MVGALENQSCPGTAREGWVGNPLAGAISGPYDWLKLTSLLNKVCRKGENLHTSEEIHEVCT